MCYLKKEEICYYRDTPYECLPIKGDKRVYLVGQEFYGRKRVEIYIENDYVLTDDEGRYIYTDEVFTREYLIALSQEKIQGSKTPTHIFLPMPRAEAIYKKLTPIQDRNNIGCYATKKEDATRCA